jgi:hypothetical protein
MSIIITTKTQLTDLDCLKEAATQVAGDIKVVPINRPNARYANREWLCDFYCPNVYNVHVVRENDGTLSLLADMDYGRVEKVYGKDFGRLKQLYGVVHTRKMIKEQRYRGLVRQSTKNDGSIVLTLSV